MLVVTNIVRNDPEEISMGQKLHFRPVDDTDGLSATANTDGFTPLTAAARFFGWQAGDITKAARQSNRNRSALAVSSLRPKLFLLPQTDGQWSKDDAARLARELINLLVSEQCGILHFTHCGFVQSPLASEEVVAVLEQFAHASAAGVSAKMVIDVDERIRGDFEKYTQSAVGQKLILIV